MGSGIGTLIPSELGGIGTFVPARGSSILNGLTHYWPLDEVSGQRNDVIGTAHLTDNNTVDSVAGKSGNAASFVKANNESLTAADTPSLRVGVADFTIAFWYKRTADAGFTAVLAKGDQKDYTFDTSPQSNLGMRFYTKSVGGVWKIAEWGAALTLNTWYLVVGWRDSVAGTVNIQVNNGTPVATTSTAIESGDTASSLAIGAFGGAGGSPATAVVDEVAFFLVVLTADERTTLYNAGAGKFYPTL